MLDRPLATLIRALVADDEGVQDLLRQARERQLWALTKVRSRVLRPSDFTGEGLSRRLSDRTPAPRWTSGIRDPWVPWLRDGIELRVATVLVPLFDYLRSGQIAASGMVSSGERVSVPPPVWSAPSVTFDMITAILAAAGSLMFTDIEVRQPSARPSRSRQALEQFAIAFDAAVAGQGRHYTTPELIRLAQRAFGSVSAREVSGALERISPSALHGRGRRPAALTPTAAELREAAERASGKAA